MPATSITWIGEDALARRLLAAIPKATILSGAALYAEGQEVIAEATPITPIEFGNLRASGFVRAPVFAAGAVTVECGFGGAAAPYAVYVHENLTAHHEPPTQAKFLEETVLRRSTQLQAKLAERMGALQI